MKKLFKTSVSVALVATMSLSSIGGIQCVYGQDNVWTSGWTGKEGSTNFTVEAQGTSVAMSNDKVNNGKFTDGEDSIVYYASGIGSEYDFELKAMITIDEYSVMEESSNPQQGSVGIGVLDELYNKTDDKAYTNSVFVGTYAEKKDSDMAFTAMYRENNAEAKTIGEKLSEDIKNSGTGLGSYELSITKSGTAYTLSCGENSQTVEINSMTEDIYPCLYIARNAKVTFEDVSLTVDTRKVTEVYLEGEPKTDYVYGEALDLSNVKVMAKYDDETTEEITDYLVKGYSPKKVGKQTVRITKGGVEKSFGVEVKNRVVSKLEVTNEPIKTDYFKSSAFNTLGLEVTATYNDGSTEVLNDSDYIVKINGTEYKNGDLLSAKLSGTQNVKITRVNTAGISKGSAVGSFNIEISDRAIESLQLTKPAKTLYYIGDELDLAGLVVEGIYTSDLQGASKEILNSNEYTVSGFDSASEGTCDVAVTAKADSAVKASFSVDVHKRSVTGIEVTKYPRTTYAVGEEFTSDGMIVSLVYDNGDVEATKDYSVDTAKLDTTVAGGGAVSISVNGLAPVELKCTVEEIAENKWRKAVFGQSSGYDKQDEGSTGVKAENYGTAEGTINVRSWDGSGKITNDHDGISYYFTGVSGDDNFTLSADIKVNKYLEHDNDDTKRNGQEAFGIMARDVVPFVDAEGNMTTDESKAQKDSEGVSIPQDKNTVFASNVALFGGYSGTGYEKAADGNRINLMIRTGVSAVDGGGTREVPAALSESFPAEGNSYRLTLQRVNGGIYASCYDYQTKTTKQAYYYDDEFLKVQNDNIYVGFFTARWADIDVSNVDFHKTERVTDQTVEAVVDDTATPSVEIESGKYTTDPSYQLKVAPEGASGRVTIKQNKKIILNDAAIGKEGITVDTKLAQNSVNKFTVVFEPDDTLNLTSYEPIVVKQSVTHKSYDSTAKTVYASNNGSLNGDGTEEKPYDLDTAIGFLAEGQTLILKEGVYKRTSPIEVEFGNNGTASKPKTVQAEEGKDVVLDFGAASAGAIVTGNYWQFKGIDFTNCGDNQKCFHLGGSNCVIEDCKFYGNRDMGLQISRTYGTDDRKLWPSNNLILNCESYNNCDPSMINADGFGAKLTVGEGNVFRDCQSHHNVDDGWDLYTKVNSGAIGAVTLENCKSYRNGWKLNDDGTETSYGAGGNNGFKLGGENVGVKHKLINCIAYGNGNNGVTTNSNPMLSLENVISYDNAGANFRLYSDKPDEYDYELKGVVSYNPGEIDIIGTINEDENYKNASATPIISDDNYITWDLSVGAINASGEKATKDMLEK